MEDGVRGPDQRAQTTARAKPQPLSGSGRDGTVGRIRGGRRHAHQYRKSFGKPEEWIKPYGAWGKKNFPRATEKAQGSTNAHLGKAPDLSGTTLGPLETLFLRRKVARAFTGHATGNLVLGAVATAAGNLPDALSHFSAG